MKAAQATEPSPLDSSHSWPAVSRSRAVSRNGRTCCAGCTDGTRLQGRARPSEQLKEHEIISEKEYPAISSRLLALRSAWRKRTVKRNPPDVSASPELLREHWS
jgi:hypothetical protein